MRFDVLIFTSLLIVVNSFGFFSGFIDGLVFLCFAFFCFLF